MSWLRMKLGFIAIVLKRKASEPSAASGPNTSAGSRVALQHRPTRSHDSRSLRALTSYDGEKSVTPTNGLLRFWQKGVSRMAPEATLVASFMCAPMPECSA